MKDNFLTDNYADLLKLLNAVKIGVFITDSSGKTLLVNDESCKTGGMTREEMVGKTVQELVENGLMYDSITLRVLKSGETEGMMQDQGDGSLIYATSIPVYTNGKIEYVITTERDVTELEILKEVLKEKESATEKYIKEIEYLKGKALNSNEDIIAKDVQSKQVVEKAIKIAKFDTTVLLLGETGTGKEVFADLIYKNSKRVGKPFIKVNCTAIPDNLIESEMFGYERGAFSGAEKAGKMGFFELANTGTLLLDEIGDLPLHIQPKLLRALQEKEILKVGGARPIPIDVRLIASTNSMLMKAVESGRFREDLYYRLNVMPIEIPPLRERKLDISELARYFVNYFGKQYKIKKHLSPSAIKVLQEYYWPGNVRELRNIIERSVISFEGEKINQFQIEQQLYPRKKQGNINIETDNTCSITEMLNAYEKQILVEYLDEYKTATKVAEILNTSRATLSRRMKKYNLE